MGDRVDISEWTDEPRHGWWMSIGGTVAEPEPRSWWSRTWTRLRHWRDWA